jgi:hypothetical protein
MRERDALAKGLRRLQRDARMGQWSRFVLQAVVRPEVAAACVPDALAIAAVLSNPAAEVDPAVLHDVRAFLTEGATSPLFDIHPAAARTAMAELRERIEAPGAADWARYGR